jgi:hypothetical protein
MKGQVNTDGTQWLTFTCTDMLAFPTDSLVGKFKVRYKINIDSEWTTANITACYWQYGVGDQEPDWQMEIDGTVVNNQWYIVEIYSPWTENGDQWEVYYMWRHDGHTPTQDCVYGDTWNVTNELGEMIDTIQPFSLKDEYHPQAKFNAIQNTRSFRLAPSFKDQNDKYENMIIWSEPDRHSMFPLQNSMKVNTAHGELAKGLYSVPNGVLGLFERSGHILRMTTEPVRYDEEEGKFQTSCLTHRGIIDYNGILFWLGIDGINIYLGNTKKDITEGIIRTKYQELLANEYAVNESYNFISGGYDIKNNLVMWHFPNSDYTIKGYTINTLAFSLDDQSFLFLNMGSLGSPFDGFAIDYDGRAHNLVRDTGHIHRLFDGNSTDSSVLRWDSGILKPSNQNIFIRRLELTYKGIPTVTIQQKDGTIIYTETWPENTSLDVNSIFVQCFGINAEINISFATSVSETELAKVFCETVPMGAR